MKERGCIRLNFYDNLAIFKKSAFPIYQKYFNPFERKNLWRFASLIIVISLEFFNFLVLPTFYQSYSNLDEAILGEKNEFFKAGMSFLFGRFMTNFSHSAQSMMTSITVESLKHEIHRDSTEYIRSGAATTLGSKDKPKHNLQSILRQDIPTATFNAIYQPRDFILSLIRIAYSIFFFAKLHPRDGFFSRIPASFFSFITPIIALMIGKMINFPSQYIGKYVTKLDRERYDIEIEVTSALNFASDHANDVAVRKGEDFEANHINSKLEKLRKIDTKYNIISSLMMPLYVITGSLETLISYMFIKFFSYEPPTEKINVAEASLIDSNLSSLTRSLDAFFGSNTQYIERMRKAVSRINSLNQDTQDSKKPREGISKIVGANRFRINNLEFPMGEKMVLLRNFPSFNRGSIIRLNAASGTGKSTFLNCIAEIYKKINSMNIELPVDDIKNIAHLTKEPLEIRGGFSLLQHIIYPKKPEDFHQDEIQEIHQKILNLIQEFVPNFTFKDQIQETINWEACLSSGQKQICAIISAIIKNPELLLLDEAMNSIDEDTKFKIQEYLGKIPNLTIIFVDHSPLSGERKFETETINLTDHLHFSQNDAQEFTR